MAGNRTFSIIKPDATRRNLTGAITAKLEEAGLRVIASRRIRMSREQAEGFYAVHKERPFFADLVAFMISGPVVVQVLEGENAVKRNRDIMGATNPENADAGTIRKEFAESAGSSRGPFSFSQGISMRAASTSGPQQTGRPVRPGRTSRSVHPAHAGRRRQSRNRRRSVSADPCLP
ncbi:MAG: nucleoside-diphosphate kinase [Sphingobium sp. 32-64-5]|nr:MAG: nucleoside-diphosphate kinase [Sphingobium sp. 32-64-5]